MCQGVAAKIRKIRGTVPAAQFDIAHWVRRTWLPIKLIGKFPHHQEAAFADQEIGAARVANLRVSWSRESGISVESDSGKRQTLRHRDAEPCARCREGIEQGPPLGKSVETRSGHPNVELTKFAAYWLA